MKNTLKIGIFAAMTSFLFSCSVVVSSMTKADCEEVSDCAPYSCDQDNIECLNSCSTDNDCVAGAICEQNVCLDSLCEPVADMINIPLSLPDQNWTTSGVWNELAATFDENGNISLVLAEPDEGIFLYRIIDHSDRLEILEDYADSNHTGTRIDGPNNNRHAFDLSLVSEENSRSILGWIRQPQSSRSKGEIVVWSMANNSLEEIVPSTTIFYGKTSAILEQFSFLPDHDRLLGVWFQHWGDDSIQTMPLNEFGQVPGITTVEGDEEVDTALITARTINNVQSLSSENAHFILYSIPEVGGEYLYLQSFSIDPETDVISTDVGSAQSLWSGQSIYALHSMYSENTFSGITWIEKIEDQYGVFSQPISQFGATVEAVQLDENFTHQEQARDAVIDIVASESEYAVAFTGTRSEERAIWLHRVGEDGFPRAEAPIRLTNSRLGTPSHIELLSSFQNSDDERGYAIIWIQPENEIGEIDGLNHLFYSRVRCRSIAE